MASITQAAFVRVASRALLCSLCITVLIAAAFIVARVAFGEPLMSAARSTSAVFTSGLIREPGNDSWAAMWAARLRLSSALADGKSVYEETLHGSHCKFQYPPSSFLLLDVLPKPGIDHYDCPYEAGMIETLMSAQWSAKRVLDWAGRLALLGTILLSAYMLGLVARSLPSPVAADASRSRLTAMFLLVVLVGLCFYPLTKGFRLGQIQVFLGFLIALAMWAFMQGRSFLAGLAVGLCLVFKPVFAVVLLWGAVRRNWRFLSGAVLVWGVATVAALALYGLKMHVDYVTFLRWVSRFGENFWGNQSLNGVLNRLVTPGDAAVWHDDSFAEFHPEVYWPSTVAGALMIIAALWPVRARARSTEAEKANLRAVDFACIVAASTIASPIAWEHHYGSFFAVAVVACGVALASGAKRTMLVLLGLAYVLMSNEIMRPDLYFQTRWTGLLGSHIWVGGLLMLVLLVVLRRRLGKVEVAPH